MFLGSLCSSDGMPSTERHSCIWSVCGIFTAATKLRQGKGFTPVCHFVHRGVSATPWVDTPLDRHPPGQTALPGQTPPQTDPPRQTTTPLGRHPPGLEPLPGQTPGQTPPCTVHAGIRRTSGRYVSYWNASLSGLFWK